MSDTPSETQVSELAAAADGADEPAGLRPGLDDDDTLPAARNRPSVTGPIGPYVEREVLARGGMGAPRASVDRRDPRGRHVALGRAVLRDASRRGPLARSRGRERGKARGPARARPARDCRRRRARVRARPADHSPLLARDPTNIDWVRTLATAHDELATALAKAQDHAGAIEQLRANIALLDRALDGAPGNKALRRDADSSRTHLADELRAQAQGGR